MTTNPIGWFEIYVQDMPRAKTFYGSVLERELSLLKTPDVDQKDGPQGAMEMWSFANDMTTYGAGGALVKMDGARSGGSGSMIYFACDDVATEVSRVEPAGGKVHMNKTSIGEYGFMAIIIDPDGNMIGLHSMK